jgi:hypothetical protein
MPRPPFRVTWSYLKITEFDDVAWLRAVSQRSVSLAANEEIAIRAHLGARTIALAESELGGTGRAPSPDGLQLR